MTTTATPTGASEILQCQTSGSFTATLSGAFTTAQSATINFVKTGKDVLLVFSPVSAATTNATTITAAAGSIPDDLLPLVAVSEFKIGTNNSTAATLKVTIGTDGSITIGVNAAGSAFTGSGNGGFLGFAIPYKTQYGFMV